MCVRVHVRAGACVCVRVCVREFLCTYIVIDKDIYAYSNMHTHNINAMSPYQLSHHGSFLHEGRDVSRCVERQREKERV